MEERIAVSMRFDACLLPSVSVATNSHVKALQRFVTPIVHSALQQLYILAENDAAHTDPVQLVCLFQKRLSNAQDFESARCELLAQLLGSKNDPNGIQYVSAVGTAFFSRLHVLTAAHPYLSEMFRCCSSSVSSRNRKSFPNYRVSANCTPFTFLHLVYSTASKVVFKNPFLFVKDVNAQKFVERRRQCMQQIDEIVDGLLYDKCNEMVVRLWKEVTKGKGSDILALSDRSRVSVQNSSRSVNNSLLCGSVSTEAADCASTSVISSKQKKQTDSQGSRKTATATNAMTINIPTAIEYSKSVEQSIKKDQESQEQIQECEEEEIADDHSQQQSVNKFVPTICMMDGSKQVETVPDPLVNQ